MSLFDKQRELYDEVRAHLVTLCPADEPLLGAVVSARAKRFGADLFGIGITAERLVLQPLDKRQRPRGEPGWVTKPEIVNCAIWGKGGGFREWWAEDSEFQLRFQTATEHYKFMAVGGWTMAKAMGDDYIAGLEVFAQYLQSCQPT